MVWANSTSTFAPVTSGRLAGTVLLVTGGAQGIGFGIASRFAAEGAEVIIGDVQVQRAEASAAQICARAARPALSPWTSRTRIGSGSRRRHQHPGRA